MKVTLKHITPLSVCSDAIRQCWASQEKSDTGHCPQCGINKHGSYTNSANTTVRCAECGTYFDMSKCGKKDKALIERVGNKFHHSSTLEHIVVNLDISGVSRALLQELARHRMASPSVKSTRFTLQELKKEEPFVTEDFDYHGWLTGKPDSVGGYFAKRASKYLVWTEDNRIDVSSVVALENLRIQLKSGAPNDIAKYCLVESFKTSLTWSINFRSLQNFLHLRSNGKGALWEIRDLAKMIFDTIPKEYQYLLKDSMWEEW